MESSPVTSKLAQSIDTVTAQMAALGDFAASNHRRQAFGSMKNQSSWPTPPTELDNDFSQDMADEQSPMGLDKSMIKLPSLRGSSASSIQSPPASPTMGEWSNKLPPIQSPPDSPATQTLLPSLKDRQLFSEPASAYHQQAPLFSPEDVQADERNDSLSPYSKTLRAPLLEPIDQGIYNNFPQFRGADRDFFRSYRNNRYDELKKIPGWRSFSHTVEPAQPQSPVMTQTRRQPPSPVDRPNRVVKPATQQRVRSSHASQVAKATPPVVAKQAKIVLKQRERNSASAEPQSARKRAAPTKDANKKQWFEVEDFSPALSTLDDKSIHLSLRWKNNPSDLSADADVHQLHPQEVEVAQELKLPAAQYLLNKRSIFEARVKALRTHKNFTKTAAQQACNIDVNKTSKLFEAYERIGWFDESYFKKFMV